MKRVSCEKSFVRDEKEEISIKEFLKSLKRFPQIKKRLSQIVLNKNKCVNKLSSQKNFYGMVSFPLLLLFIVIFVCIIIVFSL